MLNKWVIAASCIVGHMNLDWVYHSIYTARSSYCDNKPVMQPRFALMMKEYRLDYKGGQEN